MKKLLIFFSAFMFFNALEASYVGNPMNPTIIEEGFFIPVSSWMNFRLGYEGDFMSDGRMHEKSKNQKIDNFKKDINSGTFTLNLQNRIDLLAVLGTSRIRSDWRFDNSGIPSRIEIETNYRFSWATGGKAVLFEWGNTALSAGGRYSFTKPSISFITQDGSLQNINDIKVKYSDWQVDLGLAHRIDIFVPYIGTKYSYSKAKIPNTNIIIANDAQTKIKMRNKDHFGVYVGCALSNSKYFLLNVEARFIDEEAISVAGEIKF